MVRKELIGFLLVLTFLIVALSDLIKNMNKGTEEEFKITDIVVECDNMRFITPVGNDIEVTEIGYVRGFIMQGPGTDLYVVIPADRIE